MEHERYIQRCNDVGLFQQKKIQMLSHATIMREDRFKYVEFTGEVFVIE